MPFSEQPPRPPPPDVPVTDPAWYQFYIRLLDYLKRLAAAIP